MTEQLTTDDCWLALKNVIDPEIYQNIVDLGLVYDVEVEPDNVVHVTMTLTTPHCPMGPQILDNVDKFLQLAGATSTRVDIVWEPPWTPMMMTDDLKRQLGIGKMKQRSLNPNSKSSRHHRLPKRRISGNVSLASRSSD